jgi:hypothetical protein
MSPEKAFEMGFRHISDLFEIGQIADLLDDDQLSTYAVALMRAWQEGALMARALIEKEAATIQ